jgi:hypothetical protein
MYVTIQSFTENISNQNEEDPCEAHCILSANSNFNLQIFEQNSIHEVGW